jgi:hypothetical protein
MVPIKEVVAHGCHCNGIPSGLLGIAVRERILGLGADGTAVALRCEDELPGVVLGKDGSGIEGESCEGCIKKYLEHMVWQDPIPPSEPEQLEQLER